MPRSTNFQTLEYQIVGDSYISSSKDLSVQNSKNMYAVAAPNSLGTVGAALHSFPGLKVFSTGTAGEEDRGIYKRLFNNKGWKVSGNTLYSFNSTGTLTNEGTIPGGDLVSMADNGTVLFIVANGTAYTHDGTTLSTLSLSFTPVQVDYLNQQFIVLDNANQVHISDVASTTFSATNYIEPESSSDDTSAIKVFNQFLMNFGTDTVEPWENTGVGTPPFERMNGAIVEDVGVLNKNCVTSTKDALYFLGSDSLPYKLQSFQATKLTDQNQGIAELFRSYIKTNTFCRTLQTGGQDIIAFTFPGNNKTWCFSVQTGLWFELTHGVSGDTWLGKTSAFLFDKQLVGDRINGNIYELDPNTYQDNGTTKARERVFRPFSGAQLGSPRENFQLRSVRFAVETGVGVSDTSPQMMVSYSFDGGRTYSNERTLPLGEEGDYLNTVADYRNQKFTDLVVKVRYTDNTRFSLYTSSLDYRIAGRPQKS